MSEENSESKIQVSSIQNYRDLRGKSKLITLPSGAVFEIKQLTPMDFIKEGLSDIPNDFFKFIADISKNKPPNPNNKAQAKNYDLFENFLRITITKGVINPPMLLKYDKDKPELIDKYLFFSELTTDEQSNLLYSITGVINV